MNSSISKLLIAVIISILIPNYCYGHPTNEKGHSNQIPIQTIEENNINSASAETGKLSVDRDTISKHNSGNEVVYWWQKLESPFELSPPCQSGQCQPVIYSSEPSKSSIGCEIGNCQPAYSKDDKLENNSGALQSNVQENSQSSSVNNVNDSPLSCANDGYACTPKYLCQNGEVDKSKLDSSLSNNKYCSSTKETCCKVTNINDEKKPQAVALTAAPQPAIGYYNNQQSGISPYGACAAALKCVPEIYCTADGVMTDVPVTIAREFWHTKVPLTDCLDGSTGYPGKCCRDPLYEDPWPALGLGGHGHGHGQGHGQGPVQENHQQTIQYQTPKTVTIEYPTPKSSVNYYNQFPNADISKFDYLQPIEYQTPKSTVPTAKYYNQYPSSEIPQHSYYTQTIKTPKEEKSQYPTRLFTAEKSAVTPIQSAGNYNFLNEVQQSPSGSPIVPTNKSPNYTPQNIGSVPSFLSTQDQFTQAISGLPILDRKYLAPTQQTGAFQQSTYQVKQQQSSPIADLSAANFFDQGFTGQNGQVGSGISTYFESGQPGIISDQERNVQQSTFILESQSDIGKSGISAKDIQQVLKGSQFDIGQLGISKEQSVIPGGFGPTTSEQIPVSLDQGNLQSFEQHLTSKSSEGFASFPKPGIGYIPPESGYIPPSKPFIPPQSGYIPPFNPAGPPQSGFIPPSKPFIPPQSGYIPPHKPALPPQSGYIPPQSGYIPPSTPGYIPPKYQEAEKSLNLGKSIDISSSEQPVSTTPEVGRFETTEQSLRVSVSDQVQGFTPQQPSEQSFPEQPQSVSAGITESQQVSVSDQGEVQTIITSETPIYRDQSTQEQSVEVASTVPEIPSTNNVEQPSINTFSGFQQSIEGNPSLSPPLSSSLLNQGQQYFTSQETANQCGKRIDDQITWHSVIYSTRNKNVLCDAAIISEKAVVTAAHCLDNIDSANAEVKIGTNGNQQIIKVQSIARHPSYDAQSFIKDLSVVLLKEPIIFGENIQKICLSSEVRKTYTGDCLVSTSVNAEGSLEKIKVELISYADCETRLKNTFLGKHFILNDSFNCASSITDSNLCNVKIGSPIACDRGDGHYELFGLKSWDLGCEQYKKSSIFSNSDLPFIENVLSTPTGSLEFSENRYLREKLRGESLEGVNIEEKPGFGLGYGR